MAFHINFFRTVFRAVSMQFPLLATKNIKSIREHCVPLLCPLLDILRTTLHENWICSRPRVTDRVTTTVGSVGSVGSLGLLGLLGLFGLLGLLVRTNLSYWTMQVLITWYYFYLALTRNASDNLFGFQRGTGWHIQYGHSMFCLSDIMATSAF
jgi:hypothetical protein